MRAGPENDLPGLARAMRRGWSAITVRLPFRRDVNPGDRIPYRRDGSGPVGEVTAVHDGDGELSRVRFLQGKHERTALAPAPFIYASFNPGELLEHVQRHGARVGGQLQENA